MTKTHVARWIAVVGLLAGGWAQAQEGARTPGSVTGRYVRIELAGSWLHLAEVEVLSQGENVALNRPARISSCPYGEAVAGAQKGVDGHRDPVWRRTPDNSVFHTGNNGLEWWEVDLETERPIERIRLTQYLENGLVEDRIVGAWVKVLDGRREIVSALRIETVEPLYEFDLPPPDFFARYADGIEAVPAREAGMAGTPLAAGERPRAVIVLSAAADAGEKLVALSLREALAAGGGAAPPIASDADPRHANRHRVFVGQVAVKALGGERPGEREWAFLERDGDAYVLGSAESVLRVAARRLLEQTGLRWWSEHEREMWPAATLTVPAGAAGRGTTAFERAALSMAPPMTFADASFGGWCRYAAHGTLFFAPPSRHYAAHPEWYAEVGGRRLDDSHNDFCMTAPGLAEEYARNLIARVEIDRQSGGGVRQYGMGREDNAPWCECAACRQAYAETSRSDVYLAFVNRVAERVAKALPDVLLVYSAYQAAVAVPKREVPRDNVIVWLTTEGMDYSKSVHHPANAGTMNLIRDWHRAAAHLAVWHYTRSYERYRGQYDGMGLAVTGGGIDWPAASLRHYPEWLAFLREQGVTHVFFQNDDNFLLRDSAVMKTWVFSRLLEDTAAGYEETLRAFTDGYYGPAGVGVRDYLARLEAEQERHPPKLWFFADQMAFRHLTLEGCLEADALLTGAEAAVAADPVCLERVRYLRACTMDRVFFAQYPAFRRAWALAGRPAADFPMHAAERLARARAAGAWCGRVSRQSQRYDGLTEQWLAFAGKRLDDFVELPVPEAWADTPPERLYQVAARNYSFDLTGAAAARLNNDFGARAGGAATGALAPCPGAADGQALAFTDPTAGTLVWTRIRTWGGEDPASAVRREVAADAGEAFRYVRLGVYDFDTVNSGLAFELGERRWKYYPLDLDPGPYEVWLNLRYDAAAHTLWVERLVAIRQNGN